ncbi:MAG: lipopolysaccharide biosynthesis protein [Anaerolineales bacterium]|nr:lipopolysaccharide biosynthesis protein [Anaerolineales bacterium]
MTSPAESEKNEQSGKNLVQKAGRGILWNFLTFALGKVSVLVTTAILARLLTKNDFGLVSVAVIAVNYLSVVKDLGLGVALIQRREDITRSSNTVFTINLILGIFLTGLSFVIAPWFSTIFNEPEVTPVLRWLGLSFVINALGSVHSAWLMREMDYRRKFIPDMGNSLIKTIASIALAFSGAGVWALVLGQLIGSIASVVLYWIITPWKPQLVIHTDIVRGLLNFGSAVTIGDILSVIIDNLDYIIVGRLFGVEQLSNYQLAFRLPEVLLIGNLWVMAGVTYPAFSSIQNNMDDIRRAFLMSIRLIQLLTLPIALGLFLAADPIVRVVFGPKWLEVIPILRVLSIYALIYSFSYHVGDIYKATGRPHLLVWLAIAHLIVLAPAMLIGAYYFGPIGVAYGHVIAIIFKRVLGLVIAMRFVKVTPVEILTQYRPSLSGSLLMVPCVLLVTFFVKDLDPFLQLPLIVVVGALAYLVVLWKMERENLTRLLKKIFVRN